jgi:DNA-binding IclR family transcriptional regulator
VKLSTEDFFDAIKDGEWHSLNQLSFQLGVPVQKLIEYSRLLSDQGIIQCEEETKRVKLKPKWKKLLPGEKSGT